MIKTKNKKDKWIKLICGASNEDIVAIEDLCAIYTAAGVDYIDVAAEESIVHAAKKGIEWAKKVFKNSPGLMISISDGNDIHFRKAKFDPLKCPPSCPRPCEKVCPTFAIDNSGIKKSKCYGCGRCLNSCPLNLISEYEYNLSKNDLASTLQKIRPNAVEIHTEINRLDSFTKVASILKSSGMKLDKISISCGLNQSFKKAQEPEDLLKAFWERYEILNELDIPLIWQLDGRPMSGDLAPTTSRDAVKLFEKIGSDLPPGLIQLAGGTNEKTHELLNSNNLPDGIAFGSAARKIMQPLIEFAHKNNKKLYEYPEIMGLAIKKAQKFLEPWKSSSFK
ncbi:MAG: Fe-S cluster containing protein [Prochlorococcus marinus XMU1428]|nr:Fe-S cluster containing protein [Prochlorococcus marinus XMU1428]